MKPIMDAEENTRKDLAVSPLFQRFDRIADDLLGIPFIKGGRDPKIGLDCYGLIVEFYKRAFSVSVEDFLDNPMYWKEGSFPESVPRETKFWIKISSPRIGEVALFSMNGAGIDHVGIVLPLGYVLHSRQNVGCTRIRLSMLRDKLKGYVRYRSIPR